MSKTLTELQKENEQLRHYVELLEADMTESELRFAQLSQAAFEGIVIYEGENIILINTAARKLFGYRKSELVQLKPIDLIQAEAQAAYLAALTTAPREGIETYCICKDASVFPAKIRHKTIPHKGEEAKVMVVSDLTESKKVEQKLAASELRYRKLFEESNDAIYISSRDGFLLAVNEAAVQLFGYTRQELLKMNALRLYAFKEARDKFRQEIEAKGALSNYELQLLKKDGSLIDCILSTTTRRNADGKVIGYQGIIRDITERKRTEELIQAKEIAERSARLKERFLANMSHEIRTPMNAVMGFTNLLQDTATIHQEQYIKGIKVASEHLLVLINDVLDFSKIDAGKLELETIPFDLKDVLNNAIETFRIKANKKNLPILLITDEGLPHHLIGDPTRLTQILLNLLSNAIKFTEDGKIELLVKVFMEDLQYVNLSFSVKDTGIGIPKEKLDSIFNSFTQVSSDTRRRFGGTGLGLTITKKLVELQGGTISVKSKEDEGTTFTFFLKFKKANEADFTQQQAVHHISFQPLGKLTILIAEDNQLNQVVARDTIKKWGKEIVIDIANNGREAVEKIKQKKYDIILMDVQMPEMSGYEATQYIRHKLGQKDLPILAMTAYATTGEAEKTLMVGMDDYISKPFVPHKLYQKIAKLTGQSAAITTVIEEQILEEDVAIVVQQNLQRVTDLTFLNQSTSDDKALKEKMIHILLTETPDEMMKLQALLANENWPRFAAVAHKFKSSITFMGLHAMKSVVKNLQTYAEKQQELDKIPQLFAQLKQTCEKACEELREELER